MEDERLIDRVAPDVRRVDRVPYPGGAAAVGVLQLRNNEIDEAQVEARRHLKKCNLDPGAPVNQELLDRAEDCALLLRMVVDPDSEGQPEYRCFGSLEEVMARTDPDVRACLLGWHMHYQQQRAATYVYAPGDAESSPEQAQH